MIGKCYTSGQKGIVRAVARDFFDSEIKMEVLDESHEEERNGKKEHVTFAIFVQKKKHPKPPPTIVTTDQTNDLNQSQMNGSTKPVMDDDPTDDVIDTENRGNDIEKDIVPGSQSIMNLVTNFTPFYPERLWLSQEVFCEYFPYHIVFDSYLRPLQTGLHIQRLLPTLQSTEADTLDSFFKIIHPQIDWKLSSMRKFINMQFVLETKRSVITQGWGKDRPMLQLRGQMIWMENLNAMLYVCSPRVASLKELEDRCLHLSDIPQHDVTRDLILFNHQRLAEIELGKQLEQKKEELRNALNDLEAEKQKTDMLLHSMLPRQVADQLREGKKVEAGEFTIVTILFSDIVSFTNICAECRPIDIVNMLNALYVRFDKLTSVHDVYKVETIGDAYMVVGGLPIPVPSHADRIANMALGMTVACQEVMSPVTREPIKIRVGIHSGPVVAGVVGRKMPRYCLFGDTVNTASRMESHGLPGKIHISSASCQCLIEENFEISERGEILVKGKGTMKTYFVNENKNASMEEIMGKKRKASTPEKKDSVKLETDSLIKFGTDPYSHNTEAIPMVYNDEDRMAEFMKTPQRKLTPAPSDSKIGNTINPKMVTAEVRKRPGFPCKRLHSDARSCCTNSVLYGGKMLTDTLSVDSLRTLFAHIRDPDSSGVHGLRSRKAALQYY
ncbi:putative guanylate cyclase soluble subunit beta-2 isoform X2 [Apostichopus japonicus]|uniref:guanylate cyclase n=1 Tax=Stichopus japonicus TaxID=307972 RepID=A0A2G8KC36_STIJA|nr:putative guanylate cyclase soluble subunit beta-2 isoform X2 [Apostichopus japonicus]